MIGKVTIPSGWVAGHDYYVVAKPPGVNELPLPPPINDQIRGPYVRAMICHKTIFAMDTDPDHKVIIPSLVGSHTIVRMQDVPGFRNHCRNPTPPGPNMTIDDSLLRSANSLSLPWLPTDPTTPRPTTALSSDELAEEPELVIPAGFPKLQYKPKKLVFTTESPQHPAPVTLQKTSWFIEEGDNDDVGIPTPSRDELDDDDDEVKHKRDLSGRQLVRDETRAHPADDGDKVEVCQS
jgi:hypothetical protein